MKHLFAIKDQGYLQLLGTKKGEEYYLKATTKKKGLINVISWSLIPWEWTKTKQNNLLCAGMHSLHKCLTSHGGKQQ